MRSHLHCVFLRRCVSPSRATPTPTSAVRFSRISCRTWSVGLEPFLNRKVGLRFELAGASVERRHASARRASWQPLGCRKRPSRFSSDVAAMRPGAVVTLCPPQVFSTFAQRGFSGAGFPVCRGFFRLLRGLQAVLRAFRRPKREVSWPARASACCVAL